MSHLLVRSTATSGVGSAPSTVDSTQCGPTRVLVTEQEVAFATAAAISVRPATTRRGLGAKLVAAIGHILSPPEPRPHYPRRDPDFIEAARMSREMDHL
jgi:hypothetical protein